MKSRGNPITVMQFLKSSNGTHLIGHPRDHGQLPDKLGRGKPATMDKFITDTMMPFAI